MFFHSTCKHVLWFWLLLMWFFTTPFCNKSFWLLKLVEIFHQGLLTVEKKGKKNIFNGRILEIEGLPDLKLGGYLLRELWQLDGNGKSGFRRIRSLRIKRCCSIKLWKDNKCQNIAGDFWYPRKCEQAFELSDASAERSAAGCTIKLNKVAAFEGSLDICIVHTDVCLGSL